MGTWRSWNDDKWHAAHVKLRQRQRRVKSTVTLIKQPLAVHSVSIGSLLCYYYPKIKCFRNRINYENAFNISHVDISRFGPNSNSDMNLLCNVEKFEIPTGDMKTPPPFPSQGLAIADIIRRYTAQLKYYFYKLRAISNLFLHLS